MKKFIFSFLIFLLVISFADALTGSSQSYSVSMFGNSVASGDASSNNYNSVSLSENGGTTSGAVGNNLNANIGFFADSPYTQTVSITSYSITPDSVVVGSTIAFSINALNANQVWVKIIPPNSQEYILNLINGQIVNHLPIPSIVGNYQVIFYAQSSSGALASVVDSFELISQSSSNSNAGAGASASSGGGGGGVSGNAIIEQCTYNWDCSPWSVCSNGVQTRQCANIGTCVGNENKPVEQTACSEALFDISLNLEEVSVSNNLLNFNVDLIEKFGVDSIDVHLKYSIIDSNDEEIFSQIETKAVKGSLSFEKKLNEFILNDGDYTLRVDVLYGNLQRAFAEQSFRVFQGREITGFAGEGKGIGLNINFNLVMISIGILILALIVYFVLRRKKNFKVRETTNYNSVVGLEGLEVYTDSGIKLGKIYDVMISDNKIYGLMIIVDKDAGIKYSKVLIRYNYVQNVKDAVIVSSSVTENGNHRDA